MYLKYKTPRTWFLSPLPRVYLLILHGKNFPVFIITSKRHSL